MKLTQEERQLLRKLAAKAGAEGGRKAAQNMTAAQRRVRARKAADAKYEKKGGSRG